MNQLNALIAYWLAPKNAVLLLTAVAVVLVGAAYVLEYGFNAIPCQMCWWQRYVHWLLVAAGLMAIFHKAPQRGLWMFGLLALVGLSLAVWQLLVQSGVLAPPAGCGKPTGTVATSGAQLLDLISTSQALPPNCKDVNFRILGLSLAAWNVLAMLGFFAVAAASLKKGK